jgi:hypothetical protein
MHEYKHKRATARPSALKNRCVSGKVRFRDRREAIDALHRAANVRAIGIELTGSSTRREVRCYNCKDCSGVHLTSSRNWQPRKVAA